MVIGEYLLGGFLCSLCVILHTVFLVSLVYWRRVHEKLLGQTHFMLRMVGMMVGALMIILLAHFTEVGLWALCIHLLKATLSIEQALLVSFMNYASIGAVPALPQHWQILGPMEAMSGMLCFGLSTAVMFALLQSAYRMQASLDKAPE